MPPRRRFDKKSAKTFNIVHRAHDDALYYDNDASEHVLVPAPSKKGKAPVPKLLAQEKYDATKRIYTTEELSKKLNPEEIKTIRANEGLAAQYGIYFDDSNYDYMKHLKPIGGGEGVFIEAKQEDSKPKNKNIEDLFKDQLPSAKKRVVGADDLENIPTEFQGFNPNLDPRLREVLEALDDEAYIEESKEQEVEEGGEGDDDFFSSLLKSGEVDDEDEFYYGSDADQYYDDDYDEWDLDNYQEEYDQKYDSDLEQEMPYNEGEAPEELVAEGAGISQTNTSWAKDVMKFKSKMKNTTNEWDSDDDFEDEDEDVVPDLPSFSQESTATKKVSKTKLRKKKGAMTDTTSFSMTSSANYRTEGLTLLDDRYEQYARRYAKDDEEANYEAFDIENERTDLNGMLDDFLDNYELGSGGRKLVKKNAERDRLKAAADSVSKGKLAMKRKKEKEMESLGNSFGNMKF